jgi:hypothetical protein
LAPVIASLPWWFAFALMNSCMEEIGFRSTLEFAWALLM